MIVVAGFSSPCAAKVQYACVMFVRLTGTDPSARERPGSSAHDVVGAGDPQRLREVGRRLRADQVLHLHRGDVQRVAQRVHRQHRAVLLDVGVRGPVRGLGRVVPNSVMASTSIVDTVASRDWKADAYVIGLKADPGWRLPSPATSNWPWTRGSSRL